MSHPPSLARAPQVSCVIPCRNEAAHIEHCLSAVLNQKPPRGGFEVIVADGMSDDGTREILERIAGAPVLSAPTHRPTVATSSVPSPSPGGPVVWVVANPGRIVSTGLNAAIRAAHGDVIIRMDAHTIYAPDYVARCVEVLEETGADNVGGPWVAKGDGYVSSAIAAAFQSPFAVGGARSHDPGCEGPIDTVYLGCWRKETFERCGCFDEELVRNQDDEHNLRIIRGGGKVWQSPKIRSWYRPRGSLGALFKQFAQYGYWKVRVIQKHRLPASWRHLVPAAFLLALMLLFLLSAFCFLCFSFGPLSNESVVSSPWSVVRSVAHFCFLLSAFCSISLLSAYLLAVFLASFVTGWRSEWKLLPILPVVFGCYHFGYGLGFLRGILDFVILRRGASASFAVLTRGSSEAKAIGQADLRPPTSDL